MGKVLVGNDAGKMAQKDDRTVYYGISLYKGRGTGSDDNFSLFNKKSVLQTKYRPLFLKIQTKYRLIFLKIQTKI